MIRRFVKWLESLGIPVWLFLMFIVIFSSIRIYLEMIFFHINKLSILLFTSKLSYFLMTYLFVFLMLKAITDEKMDRISSALSFSVPFLIVPPIVDHFVFSRNVPYTYPTASTWANMALTFFQSNPESMYRGHQIEFAIFIALLVIYIYGKIQARRVKKFSLAVSATFFIYIAIFVLATPSIWIIYPFIVPSTTPVGFESNFSYIAYNFIAILIGFLSFWSTIILENPHKVMTLLRDASPPRIVHFSLMFVLGFFIQVSKVNSISDILWKGNVFILLMGIFSAASGWAFVVAINNYYDKEEDAITNKYRGLTSNKYTEINLKSFAILSVAAGGYTAIILGPWPFIFYAIFVLLGFIYSYPKIHMKKYGTKTIIIGLGSAVLFGMGYVTPWVPNLVPINTVFWIYFVILFIVFSAGSAMNDLKDYESDVKNGIITIFTVFGRERGKKVGAILLVVAFSLPSILAPILTPVFVSLAVLGAVLIIKERVLFIYFVYFAEYFLLLFFHTL